MSNADQIFVEISQTPVSKIVRRKPIEVFENTCVQDVLDALNREHRGVALVVDQECRLLGIFTERDVLLRLPLTDSGWREAPVCDFMTHDPHSIRTNESIGLALNRMQEGAFRHLPIVDEEERAIGVLSVRDILDYVVDHFPSEFLNLPPSPNLETTGEWGG